MKVRVNISQEGMTINEVFAGKTADEVVGAMKARVAKELNFAMRLAISAMSNLMFAQEVVKRFNQSEKQALPVPNSCDEFIQLALQQGFATLEEA